MEINKKEILRINKKFGGTSINEGSLDFAIAAAVKEKNIYRSNAYLLRGIVTDHCFSDGNKRTAISLMIDRFKKEGYLCERRSLEKGVVNISRYNIKDINKISRRLMKWCLKK